MTKAILKNMKPRDLQAIHSIYAAIHKAHKNNPTLLPASICATVLTAVMSSSSWAWRVIGITPAALRHYKAQGFKHRSKQGISRAHLRPRVDTVRELLAPEHPLSAERFIDVLLRHDGTVLCTHGENKVTVAEYIPFENDGALLFPSKQIGWRHGPDEEALLASLRTARSTAASAALPPTLAPRHQAPSPTRARAMKAPSRRISSDNARNYLGSSKLVPVERETYFKETNTNWSQDEIEERRRERHGVRVRGKVYPSLWNAWDTLGLPTSHHQRFRKSLKLEGRLTYRYGDELYDFEIVPFHGRR